VKPSFTFTGFARCISKKFDEVKNFGRDETSRYCNATATRIRFVENEKGLA
jgi:hypothetical protein